MNEEEIKALIAEIRGENATDNIKSTVESIIKADTEKAKIKAEEDKKLQENIKAASDKIKKEKQPPEDDSSGKEERERDKSGKFIKSEPQTPAEQEEQEEQEDKDQSKINELTKQMEAMAKEIEALKKRKNYRMSPPKGKEVDEVDDFIKQNITKNFEVII